MSNATAATIDRSFTVSRDENATARPVKVTVPARIQDLPEAIQAALYQDALANATIKVQGGLRRWLSKNGAASAADLNKEAQARMDAILKGVRRQASTVVVEVVKKVEIDVTALALTKEQAAVFASQENVVLVNVPDAIQKYLNK